MSAKQDRQGARTATDLEYKYNFGKSFAEVMGLAKDAQKAADEAKTTAKATDAKLTHEEIFNLLTKNGELQGLYRGDDGELYINAEYIKAGLLRADLLKLTDDDAGVWGSYVFDSQEELDTYVESTADSMDIDTQKTIGAVLDFNPYYIYGVITISVGCNGDGFKEVLVELTTPYRILHRYSWSEGENSTIWEDWRLVIDATSEQTNEVLLYDDKDGSNGTITLSDDAGAYSYLELYFADLNGRGGGYTKVCNPDGKTITLHLQAATAYVYSNQTEYEISGNTLTPNVEKASYFRVYASSGYLTSAIGTNGIYIHRVVGHK